MSMAESWGFMPVVEYLTESWGVSEKSVLEKVFLGEKSVFGGKKRFWGKKRFG